MTDHLTDNLILRINKYLDESNVEISDLERARVTAKALSQYDLNLTDDTQYQLMKNILDARKKQQTLAVQSQVESNTSLREAFKKRFKKIEGELQTTIETFRALPKEVWNRRDYDNYVRSGTIRQGNYRMLMDGGAWLVQEVRKESGNWSRVDSVDECSHWIWGVRNMRVRKKVPLLPIYYGEHYRLKADIECPHIGKAENIDFAEAAERCFDFYMKPKNVELLPQFIEYCELYSQLSSQFLNWISLLKDKVAVKYKEQQTVLPLLHQYFEENTSERLLLSEHSEGSPEKQLAQEKKYNSNHAQMTWKTLEVFKNTYVKKE